MELPGEVYVFLGSNAWDRAYAVVIAKYARRVARIAQRIVGAIRQRDYNAIRQCLQALTDIAQEGESAARLFREKTSVNFSLEDIRAQAKADYDRMLEATGQQIKHTHLPRVKTWSGLARQYDEIANAYETHETTVKNFQ